MLENLKQVDPTRPTLFNIGSDAYYHIENILKTRTGPKTHLGTDDFAVIERVVARHRPLLAAARKLLKGPRNASLLDSDAGRAHERARPPPQPTPRARVPRDGDRIPGLVGRSRRPDHRMHRR